MKDSDKLINLIAVGLDSKLAEKIVSKGYTLSKLKSASKTDLSKNFESWEISPIIEATKRKPISSDTINRLVKESDWKCCICWDISKETPLVIHHIIEHSKTKDDSCKNLVLLCLDHHALAHSTIDLVLQKYIQVCHILQMRFGRNNSINTPLLKWGEARQSKNA